MKVALNFLEIFMRVGNSRYGNSRLQFVHRCILGDFLHQMVFS